MEKKTRLKKKNIYIYYCIYIYICVCVCVPLLNTVPPQKWLYKLQSGLKRLAQLQLMGIGGAVCPLMHPAPTQNGWICDGISMASMEHAPHIQDHLHIRCLPTTQWRVLRSLSLSLSLSTSTSRWLVRAPVREEGQTI